MVDALGRDSAGGGRSHGGDRRGRAIDNFMFLMQYRRDLREAREIIAVAYPANETRLDLDISQANIALRNAVLELEASR